jgi:hypothetical protein
MMKYIPLVLKVLTAPIWIPFWAMKKSWRLIVVLIFGSVIAGCASNSANFDKSPCACDFKQINTGNYVGSDDA